MPGRTSREKDYYQILGLDPSAGDEEIKKAYRRMALRWHPDRNAGNAEATERFKEISEAYAVLIDGGKRHIYDQIRRSGRQADFRFTQEDLFRDLFANQAASAIFEELAREFERRGMRVDRQYFHQTLFGGRTVVTGGVFIISPLAPFIGLLRLARIALAGKRAESSEPPAGSRLLSGIGRVARWLLDRPESGLVFQKEDLILPLRLTADEARLGGRRPVTVPSAAGEQQLLVTIPAGVRAGTRLRLRGKGSAGARGVRGDLYLVVETMER